MKLGIYGGGFKPFTTGHFAKLADAIRDNDKVYLFYGMQQLEPPRYGKRGQVLAPRQKFRSIGDSNRTYDEKVAEEIFSIYRDALDRIPEVEVVLIQSQAKDDQGNLAAVRAPVTAMFKVLEDFVDDPGEIEKVTVYGDGASMRPYMRSPKFKDAVQAGKIQFGGAVPSSPEDYVQKLDSLMSQGEDEARQALKAFYASKGEDLDDEEVAARQSVRGTHVRNLASSRETAEEAKKFLPPFLNDSEKDRIISILSGPVTESVTRYVKVGDLMMPITEKILVKAASRFVISEQSGAASAPGEEAHIYNLYEEFSMPLQDIIEIGKLGLEGKLENVQEKMDGQFLAFTVVDGKLRFFTKMDLQGQKAKEKRLLAIQSGGKGSGMSLEDIMSTYTGSRSNIADGFAIAYKALEPIAVQYQDSLFRNGEVVMTSQIMVSKNPNTILYDKDSLRTVLAVSLTGDPVDQNSLASFQSQIKSASTDAFTMDEVPTANLIKGLEKDDSQIRDIEKSLEKIVGDIGLSVGSNTVGDYIKARVEKFLTEKHDFIPKDLIPDVADRFMTGKGKVSLRLKKVVSPEDYQKFRQLDKSKSRIVQEAIIPLENIIQRLGIMIIDKLDLALTASNQDDLLGFVKAARNAFESGFDFNLGEEDTKTLEGIRVALARLSENEDLFKRATEGIVFTYNNKTYKLTGLFTPINKLRGFFSSAMGREGFGKASLPSQELDDLNEILNLAIRKNLSEGGNAFRPRDSKGRPTGPPVTTDERIPRTIATAIEKEVQQKVLDPLGLKHLPVGSTATNKSEIGDVDLTVSEASIKNLVASLRSLPYLSAELVEGIPRVIELPGGKAATIMVDYLGKYYQVDLFTSTDIQDTAWELSGGGEGQVKGEYRNLMLSLLAKIKGERDSTPESIMKYTMSFPGGWREKINGRENHDGRIFDPDEYLPLIGIDVSKDEIRTFESLVDHMILKKSDNFLEALERYESYIASRLNSKSEKVKKEASQAIEYLSGKGEMQKSNIMENQIRKIVEAIILEQEAEESEDAESLLSGAGSFAEKARIIFKILSGSDFFGADLEKIIGTAASQNLVRLGLKTGTMEKYDFGSLINKLYATLQPSKTDAVVELAPNEMPNPSGTYPAYLMPQADEIMILFGSAGTSGGQRKAGYIYEDEVLKNIVTAGTQAKGGPDNSYSDIYIPTTNGTLGIEVKLPNAQAGEPTLRYDYDKGEWFASNPKPQNTDIANLINLDETAPEVRERMNAIKDAVNKFRSRSGLPQIESILGKVSKQEYVNVVQPTMKQSSSSVIKGSLLAAYTISADVLRVYYMLKSAGLVQVKSKGLFHLHPDFKVTIVDSSGLEKSTSLFDFPPAQGAVYFRNFRGNNYGIRAQLKNSPLKKLPVSQIDLDRSEDASEFVKIVKGSSFPVAKDLAKSQDQLQEIQNLFSDIAIRLK